MCRHAPATWMIGDLLRGYVSPMTRVLRAVSMTSLVMTVRSLIRMPLWIWAKSRWISRKFPRNFG